MKQRNVLLTPDISIFNPAAGFQSEKERLYEMYDVYRDIAIAPETHTDPSQAFGWYRLARNVTAQAVAGLAESQLGIDFINGVAFATAPVGGFLPASLTASQLRDIQEGLLYGAELIFEDLGYQGYVFKNSGLCAIEYISQFDFSAFPPEVFDAWRLINEGVETGNPTLIAVGRKLITDREQNTVVQPAWDRLEALNLITADVGWLFTILSRNPSPGGMDFEAAVPNGTITVDADRWRWIDETVSPSGILGAWDSLSPTLQDSIVKEDLRARAPLFYYTPPLFHSLPDLYLKTEDEDLP